MAETKHFDLIVIGGGPGGYVGAIRAAQLGKKVACVERSKLGGVCLNWGCIPTKALLHTALVYTEAFTHGKDLGFQVDPAAVKVDWSKVIGRSRDVSGKLNSGIGFLFKKNKIEHLEGHARIESGKTAAGPCKVMVSKADSNYYKGTGASSKDDVVLTADKVLIATGAAPRELPFAPNDGKSIISSYEALVLAERPASIVIVGSGAIGMEFAYFFNAFGSKVTVVEMLDRILPNEDEDISKEALKSFTKQGIQFRVGAMTKAVDKTAKGVKVTLENVADKKTETIEADKVLVAIGVTGRFDGLAAPALGLRTEKGAIVTDYMQKKDKATYATSVPGVYAIGDVIGPPWLAHVASEEAIVAVERMFGHESPGVHYDAIPGATYCNPQIASVGMTERQAKEKGIEYKVGKYGLKSHGKAIADGADEGLVKIIVSKKYGEILGAHIIGQNASELIHEICLAKSVEATLDDIIATMHAHPTMAESVHEAALGADGRMIHG
ncbi:MAG: dihydrolipoyl dehydrogenase [Phycisphaerales bacterium]